MQTYSYSYSIPYVIFFLVFIILSRIEYKTKKEHKFFIYNFSVILFILFIGFRGYIGWDWYSYHDLFKETNSFFTKKAIIYDENLTEIFSPGFELIIKIFKLFSENYLYFITLLSVITALSLKQIFLKNKVNVSLGFALLIAFGLNIQIDLLRNNISIILFLYSIDYLNKRKLLPYMLINIIGASIHLSSFIFIPLYFLINKNLNNIITKLLFFIGIVFYFFQIDISEVLIKFASLFSSELESKFYIYSSIESYLKSDINYFYLIIKSILAFFLAVKYDDILKQNKEILPYLNLTLLNIFSFLYFSGFSIIQSRFQILFVLSFLITIPYILKNIRFKVIGYIVFISFQIISISIRYKVVLFNYENYLFNNIDIRKSKSVFDNNAYIINPLKKETKW